MTRFKRAGIFMMLAFLVLAGALPVAAAPVGGLNYLVGSWKCTYRAGTVRLPYDATYAYDGTSGILRQITVLAGSGSEESFAYDPKAGRWTAVVLDGQGNVTIMHATGTDPAHMAYRSFYPDANVAVKFDRVSATQYTLHGTFRSGGKTIDSVDTCSRTR